MAKTQLSADKMQKKDKDLQRYLQQKKTYFFKMLKFLDKIGFPEDLQL